MTAARCAPRVSVCIPARNHGRYLEAAIRSALDQDVAGLEVIVADDASSDATPAVMDSLRDPRVRCLRHRTATGVAANRNACLAAAQGDYVAWLDADDELLPGSLSRHTRVLDAHPEVALVHAGHAVVDADGRALPAWTPPFAADAIEPAAAAFRQLLASNEIVTSTVLARRTALDDAGLFTPAIGVSSTDWEMWLRLALRGAVAYVAEPAARYRQHPNSISRSTSASGERLRCNVRVIKRILRAEAERIPDSIAAADTAHAALAAKALLHAGDAYTSGDVPEAMDAAAVAQELWPATSARELRAAMRRRDVVAARALTRTALRGLAGELAGTRFGAKLAGAVAADDAWDAELVRAGATVARVTPADAVIAAIAKWDPALVASSGRAGCNFPDRELDPNGYPRDSRAAADHLEALRRTRGVTHLVVPAVSAWWLDHYRDFAGHLGEPLWHDADCSIFCVPEPA